MDVQNIINTHKQNYPRSCAASGMELVAKMHDELDLDEFPLQLRYQDEPVGFEKLFEMDQYGIKATASHYTFNKVWDICLSENKAGRYPWFFLPTEARRSLFNNEKETIAADSNHAFITIINDGVLTLVFHQHRREGPILAKPHDIERQVLDLDAAYKVNLATYTRS